jgi:hypothetical protein
VRSYFTPAVRFRSTVAADAHTARVIDNSIVDQLVQEKFIEKVCGKDLR